MALGDEETFIDTEDLAIKDEFFSQNHIHPILIGHFIDYVER